MKGVSMEPKLPPMTFEFPENHVKEHYSDLENVNGNIRYGFIEFEKLKQINGDQVEPCGYTCRLFGIDEEGECHFLGFSFSRLHPDDQFDPETGRKIALQRLVQTFDRETRRRIWEAYINRPFKKSRIHYRVGKRT